MLKEIRLPELSDNVAAADIVKVLVAAGDAVAPEQALLEVETEKAVFEFPSPEAGVVREVLVGPGETVAVGQLLFRLEASSEAGAAPPPRAPAERAVRPPKPAAPVRAAVPAPATAPPPAPSGETSAAPLAAPSVRRLARELGVDIRKVHGFGPGGRIGAEDVKRFAAFGPGSQGEASPPAPRPLPDFTKWGEVRREPMSKVRRITADAMTAAALVPQVTQFDWADVTELEGFRSRHAGSVERAGGKLTVTAVLLRVCAEALRRFPQFNASVDMGAGEVVYKAFVNIGVAVDTERGLLVPVVKGADRKSISALASELASLAEKARGKKLLPEEMEGGTFTISNLGGVGGNGFTPIVYPPQVAILGVSRSETRPIWDEPSRQFRPRRVLPLCLTYDHRLIDGADGARFLRFLCQALEEPLTLWL